MRAGQARECQVEASGAKRLRGEPNLCQPGLNVAAQQRLCLSRGDREHDCISSEYLATPENEAGHRTLLHAEVLDRLAGRHHNSQSLGFGPEGVHQSPPATVEVMNAGHAIAKGERGGRGVEPRVIAVAGGANQHLSHQSRVLGRKPFCKPGLDGTATKRCDVASQGLEVPPSERKSCTFEQGAEQHALARERDQGTLEYCLERLRWDAATQMNSQGIESCGR